MGEQDGGSTGQRATVALVGGTGKLGSALAARLARAGYRVVIGSRDAARAAQAAADIAETAGVESDTVFGVANDSAVADADIVVVTVPFETQAVTLAGLANAVGSRVVVSTAVPVLFPPGSAPTHVEVAEGSAAEQVAALLPKARVVGALHTVSSASLAKLDRVLDADVLLTGDDSAAKEEVAELVRSIATLRPVDAGPLRSSRYVEQLTVLLLGVNVRVRRNTGVRVTNLPDDRAMPGDAPKP